MENQSANRTGRCTCGQLRYQVSNEPLIVHGCHCRGCQKNSGSAFAVNALFETKDVHLTSGKVETIAVPTPSGKGQMISRCGACKVAVWSTYNMGGLREEICFIRVGTLDDPDLLPPDVHIYTNSKQPWFEIAEGNQQAGEFYNIGKTWSFESLRRLKRIENTVGIQIS